MRQDVTLINHISEISVTYYCLIAVPHSSDTYEENNSNNSPIPLNNY